MHSHLSCRTCNYLCLTITESFGPIPNSKQVTDIFDSFRSVSQCLSSSQFFGQSCTLSGLKTFTNEGQIKLSLDRSGITHKGSQQKREAKVLFKGFPLVRNFQIRHNLRMRSSWTSEKTIRCHFISFWAQNYSEPDQNLWCISAASYLAAFWESILPDDQSFSVGSLKLPPPLHPVCLSTFYILQSHLAQTACSN